MKCPCQEYMKTYSKHQKYLSFLLSELIYLSHFASGYPVYYNFYISIGQPNIIYYAADVFKAVGFCSEFSSTLASVGLGLMKVISTAISLSIVDRIGRKKALISGITVMGLGMFQFQIKSLVTTLLLDFYYSCVNLGNICYCR